MFHFLFVWAGDISITPRTPLANDCHYDELKRNWTTLSERKGIAILCYWTFRVGTSAISGLLRLPWTIKLPTCLKQYWCFTVEDWRWIVFSCLCFTLVFTVKTSLHSCVPSILFLTYTRRQIRWHGSNMLLNTYLWVCCPPLVCAVGKLYKLSTNYSTSCCWLKRKV